VLLDKICRKNGMAFEGALRSAPQLLGEQLAAIMSPARDRPVKGI
jgi:hypothetical protein